MVAKEKGKIGGEREWECMVVLFKINEYLVGRSSADYSQTEMHVEGWYNVVGLNFLFFSFF